MSRYGTRLEEGSLKLEQLDADDVHAIVAESTQDEHYRSLSMLLVRMLEEEGRRFAALERRLAALERERTS